MKAVPAIDLLDGKCVRLAQGDYRVKTVYHEDPVALAKEFERVGFNRIHVVDLEGAKSGVPAHLPVLSKIAKETSLQIDYSGGLRTGEAIEAAIDQGAAFVIVGSLAVKNPNIVRELLLKRRDQVIIGIDVREGLVAVNGWKEQTTLGLNELIENFIEFGLLRVMVTDIGRDGMLTGPNTELYKEILISFPTLKLIASGGVSSIGEVKKLISMGAHEVIVGKAWYEGRITAKDIKDL